MSSLLPAKPQPPESKDFFIKGLLKNAIWEVVQGYDPLEPRSPRKSRLKLRVPIRRARPLCYYHSTTALLHDYCTTTTTTTYNNNNNYYYYYYCAMLCCYYPPNPN